MFINKSIILYFYNILIFNAYPDCNYLFICGLKEPIKVLNIFFNGFKSISKAESITFIS